MPIVIRVLTVCLFLFYFATYYTQNSCRDSLVDLEKKFYQVDKKGKSNSFQFVEHTFSIAECYRKNNDTTALRWYRHSLRVAKTASNTDHNINVKVLHYMGLSAYYTTDYE